MRLLLAATLAVSVHAQTANEFFESRIRPVLATHCYSCHSSANKTSGLSLDTKAGIDQGGSRGSLFIAGEPEKSLLIRALSHADPQIKMPPPGKLPANVIEDFRTWIRIGAPDPRVEAVAGKRSIDWEKARRHWAFQPVRDPQPPTVRHSSARHPVDRFLLARLEAAGIERAPAASKRALLRRVTFDLTGLPPSPAEIAAFVNDASPDAYAKVVERLLASPHYGERWARHWFDVVRFAETNGHEFDFYKFEGWRYRDYVIRAFNDDLPYDRFVTEQLAADLMPDRRLSPDGKYVDSIIGTGFLGLQEERNGATDLEEVRTEMRDSRIDVLGKAFLGLTIACARCHDHKFDPIPTEDYYALGGIIDSTRTTLGSIASPAVMSETESVIRRMRGSIVNPVPAPIPLADGDELYDAFDDPALPRWHASGGAFRGHSGGILDSSRLASNRLTGILVSPSFVPTKKYIHVRLTGTKFNPVREEPSKLAVTVFAPGRYPKGVAGNGDRKLRWKTITLKEEIGQVCHLEIADRLADGHIAVDAIVFSNRKEPPAMAEETLPDPAGGELEAAIPEEPFGRVSYEDAPKNMKVHIRGNHLQPGPEVDRHFLTILGASDPTPFRNGSGRRALATALTAPANPLFARVMVNRIWKHHFGEGLVATVDNFGLMGERPSHPELLDWLASRFVESGWSVKAMHRMIVSSEAYRMSSLSPAGAQENDPRNRLLSHMAVRRLDAESIRDAILSVSGSIDPAVHGPSVTPHVSPWQDGRGKPQSGPLDGNGRRSVYIEVRRNFLSPLLLAFDYPLPTTTMGRRAVSSVPAQALTLLNNEFVNQQAEKWATRAAAAYSDPAERLDAMYESAFARRPDAGERNRIQQFLRDQGTWPEVAHVLFNAKEFLFLE